MGNISFGQVNMLAKKFKVNTNFIYCFFDILKLNGMAKEIFLHDCDQTWNDVKRIYGVGIEPSLRTFAGVLKREVIATEKKNRKSRPITYLDWFKKTTQKVHFNNSISF